MATTQGGVCDLDGVSLFFQPLGEHQFKAVGGFDTEFTYPIYFGESFQMYLPDFDISVSLPQIFVKLLWENPPFFCERPTRPLI